MKKITTREKKRAKRRDGKKKKRLRECAAEATQARVLAAGEVNVLREVEYIIGRAREGDGRVVSLGSLVLFSTATGDAWLLDKEDRSALCLARNRLAQPYHIVETPSQFAIEWTATFAIEGDAFIVQHQSGQARAIVGYPVAAMRRAIDRPIRP